MSMRLLKALAYPDQTFRYYAESNVRHTPDTSKLFENSRWNLFVCDDLKQKHRAFPKLLKFGPTLFEGFTQYPTVFTMHGFTMFYNSPTDQIVPLHAEQDGFFPRAKIKGQLHSVTPDLIHSLDIRYQNGVLFRRRRVKLLLPYHRKMTGPWVTLNGKPLPRALQGWRAKETSERIHVIEAWMYVGKQSYWDQQIDGGYNTLQCPIQFPNVEKNWLPRYYEYTRTFEESQRNWQEAKRPDR